MAMNLFICIVAITTLLVSIGLCESFVLNTPNTALLSLSLTSTSTCTSTAIASSTTKTTEDETASSSSSDDDADGGLLLKRDRYVATNRFAVRDGKEAKFEKRWATRKSRLATLQGFKYFHLMRRVKLNENDEDNYEKNNDDTYSYDGGNDKESAQGNYVSFTIWEKKSDFSVWRKGDAFKEAHGGTSIKAFVSTMVNSALVLRGAPKPAFYDGLLLQSKKPDSVPETIDGWRNIEVPEDGTTLLPTECFVACNQFFVSGKDNAIKFEQRWKVRESKLKDCDGFVSFTMLRRDGQAKGHGTVEMDENLEPTYLSTTIWKDRISFNKWRNGNAFSKSHGGQQKKDDGSSSENSKSKPPPQGPPMWNRPPKPIFYEGTLVITSADGA